MTLRQRQSKFARMTALLILFAFEKGYEITFGDAYCDSILFNPLTNKKPHRYGSFHHKRLAIDLNLFRNGRYLRSTKSHRPLGEFWESIGGTWGGRFKNKDGNHYSLGE